MPSSYDWILRSLGLALVFVFLLGTVSPAPAQVEVRLGLTEGGQFATFVGQDQTWATAPERTPGDLDRRPGLIIGGVAVFDLSGPLAVQSEVLWIWKGAKGTLDDVETTLKLNYMEVPVLATYRLPLSWAPVTPHVLAGPTIGITTTAVREQFTRTPSGSSRLTSRTELGDTAGDVDVGLAVGVGLGYRFSEQATLQVDVRHRRSLTRALDGPAAPDDSRPTPDAWNQGVAVTLGFVYSTGWTF